LALEDQILAGTFEFALNQLVDDELDLSRLDAKFNNDETGASAYHPRVMLKIVLLAYSRGLIGSPKGAIQGYAAQAAVDDKHQIIVAAMALGSGSEQAALLPMVELAKAMGTPNTLFTADAGYHSAQNLEALQARNTPALIADNQMRQRDERYADQQKHRDKPHAVFDKTQAKQERDNPKPKLFGPQDFYYDEDAGVSFRPAVPKGRAQYGKRMGTVEPVFANLRHNKRLNRFTLRGQCKVNTQWHLYCLVHNIEKIANNRV
jgi:IS5 family transposase